MALALTGATLLHLALLLGASFRMPSPVPKTPPTSTLEIAILRHSGVVPPTPDPNAALSQRARAGESAQGTGALTSRQGLEPEPSPEQTPESAAADEPVPAQRQPEPPPPKPKPPRPADPLDVPAAKTLDAGQLLASRNREIARLAASLESRSAAYASRVRRKSVSASTREYRYASYLGAWARKVENIGNLNFPPEAKQRQIYGSLILHVAVRRDGSVESVRVVRSSGYPLLDEAAIRIVELAAPFSPFSPEIAAETDVLDIVRTWQFLRGGRLGWQ